MFDWLFTADGWLSLVTLLAMEVVLGVDNVIFITILAGRLPESDRKRARTTGLAVGAVMRLGLLSIIAWIVGMTQPLFTLAGHEFTGKSLILLGGGLFLLYKATKEIHAKLEGEHESAGGGAAASFGAVIVQIAVLDLVFALDSIITAVGMTPYVSIMVIANLGALAIMVLAAGGIASFVDRHPAVKMLALAFLLTIGVLLLAEGMGMHVPKGYVYFAMAFSVLVELLNIRAGTRNPVKLHETPRVEERG